MYIYNDVLYVYDLCDCVCGWEKEVYIQYCMCKKKLAQINSMNTVIHVHLIKNMYMHMYIVHIYTNVYIYTLYIHM